MCSKYSTRGGKTTKIEADNIFEPIHDEFSLKEVLLITCDADCYVTRAKRPIHEVKDQICCARMLMSYKYVPKRMTIEMVKMAVTTLVVYQKQGIIFI